MTNFTQLFSKMTVLAIISCPALQVVMWLNQNFLLQEDITVEGHSLSVNFLSLRGSGPLVVKMEQSGQVSLLSEFVQIKICRLG